MVLQTQKSQNLNQSPFNIHSSLLKEAIEEYQEIYKETYGIEIPFEKAQEGGVKLLRLFRLVYQPIPNEWLEKIDKQP